MPAMSSPPTFDAAVEGLKFGTMVFSPVSRPQNRFDISQVDTMPEVISRINPIYPYKARQKGINGMVVLKFLVTGEGRVAQVSVEQANPPGVFDAAAIQAVNQWRFKPGILDREPVATWITVPLKFQIK
jgi:protein TonB